ncbi:MAG: flagellar basal-body rod modification protein FlgD [Thermoleophilaceae bacterium]|jgi:flagellar basal-body rod modification protein FlgD|nr:flagellar basal-body rod modification protein FlgD [Thermoleophilaceae bacterium]
MSTDPITQALTGNTAGDQVQRKTGGTLGKDDFLKLLVGQLQHQDPLSPSDDQQWIGQMAAFSQLEQVSNTAATTQKIVDTLNTNGTLSLIGRTVTYLDEAGVAHSGAVDTVDMAGGKASLTVGGVAGIDAGTVTQVR